MLESSKKLVIERTNILLTRPEEDSIKLSKLLDRDMFNFYIAPLIQIKKKNYNYDRNNKFDYIIFTSKNGILNFQKINQYYSNLTF